MTTKTSLDMSRSIRPPLVVRTPKLSVEGKTGSEEKKAVPQVEDLQEEVPHSSLSYQGDLKRLALPRRESSSLLHKFRKISSSFQPRLFAAPGSNSESTAAVRSLLGQDMVYRIRVADVGTVLSSGGGTVLTSIPFDPSSFSVSDWSNLSTLFDLVLLEEARIQIVPTLLDGFVNNAAPSCAVGINLAGNTTAPASVAAVASLTGSRLCAMNYIRGNAPEIVFTTHRRPNRVWAPISAPSGSGPDSGTFGAFWIASSFSGNCPATQDIFDYMIEVVLLLRVRG